MAINGMLRQLVDRRFGLLAAALYNAGRAVAETDYEETNGLRHH